MEAKIVREFENPLLRRKELEVEVYHPGAGTPDRKSMRERLSGILGAQADSVFIRRILTETGLNKSLCVAEIYRDPGYARIVVPRHIVDRDSGSKKGGKSGG
ncbi:MAG: 30S ribosomal protein S24e [Candidatus Bathyarchaeia archaeon]